MSDQDRSKDGSLVRAESYDVAPRAATNPLISRGLADLIDGRLFELNNARSYFKSGLSWYEKGECDKAILDLNEAIHLDPDYAPAYNIRGMAWVAKNGCNEAIGDLTEAIRLDPNHAAEIRIGDRTIRFDPATFLGFKSRAELSIFFMIRGIGRSDKREYDEGIRDFDLAIRLHPLCDLHFLHRGSAWLGKRDYDRAIKDFEEAMRLNPNHAGIYNKLGWTLATCAIETVRDARRAVRLATRACELTDWTSGSELATLAAAYAELGEFDQAQRYQMKALEPIRITLHSDK